MLSIYNDSNNENKIFHIYIAPFSKTIVHSKLFASIIHKCSTCIFVCTVENQYYTFLIHGSFDLLFL